MDSGHGLTSNSAKVDRVGEVPCTARLFSTYHKFVTVCLPLGGWPSEGHFGIPGNTVFV
jgi:hypothetical protein